MKLDPTQQNQSLLDFCLSTARTQTSNFYYSTCVFSKFVFVLKVINDIEEFKVIRDVVIEC